MLAAGADDVVEGGVADDDLPGLEALFDRALVWGDPDLVHLTATVRDAVGPYPGGLGRPAAALFARVGDTRWSPSCGTSACRPTAQPRGGAARRRAPRRPRAPSAPSWPTLDDDERDVLDRLAAGPAGRH